MNKEELAEKLRYILRDGEVRPWYGQERHYTSDENHESLTWCGCYEGDLGGEFEPRREKAVREIIELLESERLLEPSGKEMWNQSAELVSRALKENWAPVFLAYCRYRPKVIPHIQGFSEEEARRYLTTHTQGEFEMFERLFNELPAIEEVI